VTGWFPSYLFQPPPEPVLGRNRLSLRAPPLLHSPTLTDEGRAMIRAGIPAQREEPPRTATCPECANHKCVNCTIETLDYDDQWGLCACPDCGGGMAGFVEKPR